MLEIGISGKKHTEGDYLSVGVGCDKGGGNRADTEKASGGL